MPHECTNCNRTFPDGSKEMLSGCPDCGGNKFRYRPEGGRIESDQYSEYGSADGAGLDGSEAQSGTGASRTRAAETVSNAASTLRDIVGGSDDSADPTDPAGSQSTTDPAGSQSNRSRDESGTADRSRDGSATETGPDPGSPGSPRESDATSTAGRSDPAADSEQSDTTTPEQSDAPTSTSPRPGEGPAGSGPSPDSADSTRPEGAIPGDRPTDSTSGPDPDRRSRESPDTDAESGDGPGGMAETENAAQASARSSVVDPDEIEGAVGSDPSGIARSDSPSTGTTPGGPGSNDDPGSSGSGGTVPDDAGRSGRNDAGWSEANDSGTGPDGSGSDAPAGAGGSDGSGTGSNIEELRAELNDQFESIKIVEPGQYELNLMELYDREEYIISLMEDGRYVIEVPEKWRGDAP